MYRILLPNGELVLALGVTPIYMETNDAVGYTCFREVGLLEKSNTLYVLFHDGEKGILASGLDSDKIRSSFNSLLKNGYCDLSFAKDATCEFMNLNEFNSVIDAFS